MNPTKGTKLKLNNGEEVILTSEWNKMIMVKTDIGEELFIESSTVERDLNEEIRNIENYLYDVRAKL